MTVPFRTAIRAAVVDLLEDYAADASLSLQVYRARPRSINPPVAFIDRIVDPPIDYLGPQNLQRTTAVEIVVLHGLFDGGVAVDQADVFVDGFLRYVAGQVHAAGGNTTIALIEAADESTYVPDWLPPDLQRTYFATRITLEGYIGDVIS